MDGDLLGNLLSNDIFQLAATSLPPAEGESNDYDNLHAIAPKFMIKKSENAQFVLLHSPFLSFFLPFFSFFLTFF